MSEALAERVDLVGVLPFADAAARTTAIPSPVEGQMSSLADTDSVERYNGSAWVAVGPGKIFQVLQTSKLDAFSTTSTSFVDVTGMSQAITPSQTSSKILVFINVYGGLSSANDVLFNLVRDSTNLLQGTGGTNAASAMYQVAAPSSVNNATIVFLDSPSTTSATTYKLQMRVSAGTGTINRRGADTAYGVASTITTIEVGA